MTCNIRIFLFDIEHVINVILTDDHDAILRRHLGTGVQTKPPAPSTQTLTYSLTHENNISIDNIF